MTATERAARALLDWWDDAGVDAASARALAAPAQGSPARPPPQAPPPVAAPKRAPVGPIDAARALSAQAQDLKSLAAAISAFEGCTLKNGAKNTVVHDGIEHAAVLIIGEAPGQDEDLAGKPFVGRAGQLLDRMLAGVGLSRKSNALISNCVFWRPPANRTPTPDELALCRPFVDRLIALTQPKLVLLVGGVAGQSLLNRTEGVTRLRGQRLRLAVDGLTTPVHAMVMLHPAYLLRQPAQKRLAWADLLALEAWADELAAPRDPRV